MCQMPHVSCQVSGVRCQVSCDTFYSIFLFLGGWGQNDGASQWRVCYQWGIPRPGFAIVKELDKIAPLKKDLPPTRSIKLSDFKMLNYSSNFVRFLCVLFIITREHILGDM